MDCPDDEKFQIVSDLTSEFKKEYQVIDVDGARVAFENGWGLIRASTPSRAGPSVRSRGSEDPAGNSKIFMNKLAKKGLGVK